MLVIGFGALLIGIVGIEMSLPADSGLAPLLPLYGPLEVMRVALGVRADLTLPLMHALGSALGLFAPAAIMWHRRTRVVPTTAPADSTDSGGTG